MWEAIRRNRRNSFILVAAMAMLFAAVGAAIGGAMADSPAGGLAVALAVWSVLSLIAWFGGDKVVLMASGAKAVTHGEHPQLWNVVEEMSIASGMPMPRIYIIDDSAPNAFATGRTPKSAAVAVTTGLLDKLERDELQGVMAHEMAHVRNRDSMFMTLLGVLVGSTVLFCDSFLRMIRFGGGRRRSRSSGPGSAIMVLVAIVLAIIAPIIARLMYLAVSRRREYLADASAVEFSRYPEGLARALEKISTDNEVLEAANRATAHLYVVNPFKPHEERYSAMGSTHPPVAERIKVLRAMAGGSVGDYESARSSLHIGPRRSLVGKRTLRDASENPVPLRPKPRTGTRTPAEMEGELRSLLGGGWGMWFLLCACGAPVIVAGGPVAGGVVQCVACGVLHDVARSSGTIRRFGESTSRTARFEDVPGPLVAAARPQAEARDGRLLKVDWADEVGPVKPAWKQDEPMATVKAASPAAVKSDANPFGIAFDSEGRPAYPPSLTCPHCGKNFDVPEGFIGSRGPCPKCREMIVFFR